MIAQFKAICPIILFSDADVLEKRIVANLKMLADFIGNGKVENQVGAFIGKSVILVKIYADSGHYRPGRADIEYFMNAGHGIIHTGSMVCKV